MGSTSLRPPRDDREPSMRIPLTTRDGQPAGLVATRCAEPSGSSRPGFMQAPPLFVVQSGSERDRRGCRLELGLDSLVPDPADVQKALETAPELAQLGVGQRYARARWRGSGASVK